MDIIFPNMSPHTNILLLFSLWASLQEGADRGHRRCSVFSWGEEQTLRLQQPLDSECHYFCHLDIIWVNTPSKTSVYGLGIGPSRRRRSTTRCSCANADDYTCFSFCQHRFEASTQAMTPKKPVKDILSFLKIMIKRSSCSQHAPGGQDSTPAAQ